MTDQTTSITDRLCQVGSPLSRQNWEQNDGYYVTACRVSPDDIHQLIEIACKWSDPSWPDEDSELMGDSADVELIPVTAWRTLAEMRCSESVEPLIAMLGELDEYDDWSVDELPHVFGKIGKPAILPLVQLVNDAQKQEFVRSIAATALYRVARYHPETRDEVVAYLTEMMTRATENDIDVNSSVLDGLVELHAVEAAEAIERAFSSNRLDVGMRGDWEVVRKELGVEGLRLEMPKHPHNSVAEFRTRTGIGIFSEEPVFDDEGCVDDAVEAYYEQAWNLFSKSKEAEQVIERFGRLRWVQSLLEFGTRYIGEIVDSMTPNTLNEFVFDYVPRKVSTTPESAASIILELAKFWEYIDRVFGLPQAKPIIEWLNSDGLANQLEAELSDPANYGMAKSIVMAGMRAGYDMTSQQGCAEYMAEFNRLQQPSADVFSSGPIFPGQARVGRNDPCPCGSGKKFKKCCYRS